MFAKIATYLLIALTFIPLAIVDIFFYPAVTTKTMLFSLVVLACYSLLSIAGARGEEFYWGRLKKKAAWIPLVLLFVAYLSSLLGVDFYHSFWGLFDRGQGLIYGLTLPVAAFYMALLTFTKKDGETFLKMVSIAATIVSILALFQWSINALGVSIPWFDTHGMRIGGTLGNAAFLAAYLGMTVWVTAIVHEFEHVRKWRNFAKISMALQLLAILATVTRGTLLALILMGLVALVWLAIKGKGKARTYWQYSLVVLILFAGLFVGFRSQLATIPFEPVARLASISLQDETTANRLFVWGEALTVSGQHFLTGIGAEHIAAAFNATYDPSKITEEWFDRTHNIYLDYLLQYGVLGLVAFLTLLGALFFTTRSSDLQTFEKHMLYLLFGTYLVQNIFVFDTVSTFSLLLFLFVYVLLRSSDRRSAYPVKALLPLGYGKAVLGIVLMLPVAILPAYANYLSSLGYKYHVADVPKANAYFNESYTLGTYADIELGWQLYSMYTDRQRLLEDKDAQVAAYEEALKVLSLNAKKYPYDARTKTYLAHVIDSRPAGVEYDEVKYRELLEDILELSPKRSQAWYLTANIFLKKGDAATSQQERADFYNQALQVIDEYITLVPALAEPYFIEANLHLALQDKEKAEELFAEGEKLYKGRAGDARRATGYLISTGQYNRVEPYLEDLADEEPTAENLYDLAKIKYLNGDMDGAVVLVNRVYVLEPAYIKSDPAFLAAFLSAYNEGKSTVKLNVKI